MSTFDLFVYGGAHAPDGAELRACRRAGRGTVLGTLYDVGGEYPALMLYGDTEVTGEIWRCPAAELRRLDAREHVRKGLFRRVAVAVQDAAHPARELPCWCYVAGPALSRRLVPDRRIGAWRPPSAKS